MHTIGTASTAGTKDLQLLRPSDLSSALDILGEEVRLYTDLYP